MQLFLAATVSVETVGIGVGKPGFSYIKVTRQEEKQLLRWLANNHSGYRLHFNIHHCFCLPAFFSRKTHYMTFYGCIYRGS